MVTLGFATAEAQAAVEATQPQSEREAHARRRSGRASGGGHFHDTSGTRVP